MRVTKGRVKTKQVQMVRTMYEDVRDQFGFIDLDIVTDMWKLLENPEAVLKQPVLFKRTLKEYRAGKINGIFDAYYARSAYARFLRMMAKSPHYPKDPAQNEDFFKKMWELLGQLWKKEIPVMRDVVEKALAKKDRKAGKKAQTRAKNQTAVEQLSKLVDYGQKVLELLDDPLFKDMFAPPPPKKQKKRKKPKPEDSKGEPEDDDTDADAPGFGDKETDKEGDDSGSGSGGEDAGTESTLGRLEAEFRTWQPMMVEGVLFSQDLKMMTKLNPKGKWAPTPFPDNNVDVHTMKDMNDLRRLLPREYALPEDMFYLKAAKKELLCKEFLAKTERRQILYVLLDVSGSMHGKKVMMVASVVLALLRKVIKNGDHYYLRFFDYSSSELLEAHDVETAQSVAREVVRNAFSGGGTNIHGALMTAINDIKQATQDKRNKAEMKDAQILLLTDGLDGSLRPDTINKEKGEIEINSVVVHGTGGNVKDCSDSYHEVKPGEEEESSLDLVQVFDKKSKKKLSKNKVTGDS